MAKSFTASIGGRGRDWTLTITTSSGTGSAVIDVMPDVRIAWGDPGQVAWGAEVLPSWLRLRLYDTDTNELFTELVAITSDFDALVAIDSDDGLYKWRGVVRLDSITRPKFPAVRKPILDLYVYDGLSGLGDFRLAEQVLAGTNDGLFQIISAALTLARDGSLTPVNNLDVDVVFDIAPNPHVDEYGDDIEIAGLTALRDNTEGFGSLSWRDALNELCELFNLRVFQQFEDYRTALTWPRWFAGHRTAIGSNISTGDGATMKLSHTTESNADVGGVGKSSEGDEQTAAELISVSAFAFLQQVYRVEYDVKVRAPLSALVISRDPRPLTLGSDWILDTGSPVATGTPSNGTGYGHLVLDDTEAVIQHTVRVAKEWASRINVQVSCNANLTSAGSGTLTFTVQNRNGGSGAASIPFTVQLTSQAAFVGDDDFSSVFSIEGEVSVKVEFDGAGLTCEVSDIYVELRDADTLEPIREWTAPVTSSVLAEGATIMKRSPIVNIRRSNTSESLVQALLTDQGANDHLSSFRIQNTGTVFFDLLHALGTQYLEMRSEPVEVIRAEIMGIFGPERALKTEGIDGSIQDYFVGGGVEVDIVREITRGSWVRNLGKRFTFLDESTIWLGTPESIVASGGVLTSWDDLAPDSANMNTVGPAGIGDRTQPSVDVSDADFGTAVQLDSDSDHRATSGATKLSIGGADDDVYMWVAFRIDTTPAASQRILCQVLDSAGFNVGPVTFFFDPGTPGTLRINSGPGAPDNLVSASDLDDGVAHLAEVKYTGGSNLIELYVDGVLEDSQSGITSFGGFSAATPSLRVGDATSSVTALLGSLGLIKINNSIPSSERLTEIRNFCRDSLGCTDIA